MRCLYCGEPLSLLRKLTGKAEFCSDAHRDAYQEEFNSLALQRLASQPKQSRRTETSAPTASTPIFTPPPEPDPEPLFEVSEPFAGLPFPEDPEDFELDLAEEPAPLWGYLNDVPPPAGQEPPSYSFPLRLADYPRDSRMSNGVAWGAEVGRMAFSGYVDLPEPMDVDLLAPEQLPAQPLLPHHDGGAPTYSRLLSANPFPEVPASEDLLPLAVDFGQAPGEDSLCTIAPPQGWQPATLALRRPTTPTATAHQAPCANPLPHSEPRHLAGECEALTTETEYALWPSAGQVASWCRPRSQVVVPIREITAAPQQPPLASLAAHPADGQAEELTLERAEFDVERILIVPVLTAPLELTLAPAPAVALEFADDANTEAEQHGPPLPAPFAPQAAAWSRLATPQAELSVPAAGLAGLSPGAVLSLELAPAEVSADSVAWPLPSHLSATTKASLHQALPLAEALTWAGPPALEPAPMRATTLTPESFAAQPPVARHWAPQPPSLAWAFAPALDELGFDCPAIPPIDEEWPVPEDELPPEPAHWAPFAGELHRPTRTTAGAGTLLGRVRVKDFTWPEFAAGCDSLFAPDQPFRFHEVPFPQRGTSDMAVGDVLRGDVMQALELPNPDPRFAAIVRPMVSSAAIEQWMNSPAAEPQSLPTAARGYATPAPPSPTAPSPTASTPTASTPAASTPGATTPAAPPSPSLATPGPKATEPPASWQQAARAMYEGEQQVPREQTARPPQPSGEAKPVTAVPVITPEPLTGRELAHSPRPEPPTPFVKDESLRNEDKHRSPANEEGPQFEWRREQPHQTPPPPPPNPGSATVSVNTTIVVEGSGSGIVVENAVRISLGNKPPKKKNDAVDRFAEGEELAEGVQIAPPESLPEFVAEPAELRPMLQPISSLSESIQWPKFSVMPMRRRVAFGPPAKTQLFGGPSASAGPKQPVPEAKPLPPKKSVGFLFKKLTNS